MYWALLRPAASCAMELLARTCVPAREPRFWPPCLSPYHPYLLLCSKVSSLQDCLHLSPSSPLQRALLRAAWAAHAAKFCPSATANHSPCACLPRRAQPQVAMHPLRSSSRSCPHPAIACHRSSPPQIGCHVGWVAIGTPTDGPTPPQGMLPWWTMDVHAACRWPALPSMRTQGAAQRQAWAMCAKRPPLSYRISD